MRLTTSIVNNDPINDITRPAKEKNHICCSYNMVQLCHGRNNIEHMKRENLDSRLIFFVLVICCVFKIDR